MQNKYQFTKLILIMWKNNEEIRRFVDISRAEGMEVELILAPVGAVKGQELVFEPVGGGNGQELVFEPAGSGNGQEFILAPADAWQERKNIPAPDSMGKRLDMNSALIITDIQEVAEKASELSLPVVAYSHADVSEPACPHTVTGIKYTIEELCEVEESYFNMVYKRAHKQPVIIAETGRTLIREMTTDDLPALYELYADEKVKKYVEPLYDYNEELEFTRAYIENMYTFYGYGLWLVFDKLTGKLIGRAGISNRVIDGEQKQELGYIIAGSEQRQGLGYEVSMAVLHYAHIDLGLSEMYLCAEKTNEPSIALAKKIGFTFYGETDEYFIFRIELPV